MAFTAGDVLSRVRITLNDTASTRWPLTELLTWLNDGCKEITLQAPEAVGQVGVLSLVSGTLQTLPDECLMLLRVHCNVTGSSPNYVRGTTITPIQRAALSALIPGWESSSVVPFAKNVAHVIEDVAVHRNFWVFPGNDGTGKLQAVIAKRPAVIATPGSPTAIGSYTATVELDDIYLNAIVAYVAHRALLKEINVPGAKEASMAQYQIFTSALGIRQNNEQRVNSGSVMDPAAT